MRDPAGPFELTPDRAALLAGDDEAGLDADIFELAPVSLWVLDYSALKAEFEAWRAAGVQSLDAHFAEDPSRVRACVDLVRVVKVNQFTLELYEASSRAELLGSLSGILALASIESLASEFVQLWNGNLRFVLQAVNRSVYGRHIDVVVTGAVLPGHEETLDRVLVAIQDITPQEVAFRKIAVSERYARGLFDYSPISLWVQDLGGIKHMLDDVRGSGIVDFRVFIDEHREFIQRCHEQLRIVDVNDHTLRLVRAPDRTTLLARWPDVFRDRAAETFKEQIVQLWEGKLRQEREITGFTLDGEELTLHMELSVFPGHENDWSRVLVAITDITPRKKAEDYLEYLSTHDELTDLFNRAFFVKEIERLQRTHPSPVSVIIIDVNGLKRVNDEQGHTAGDDLIRRLGEVLCQAVGPPSRACRIGGDEFAILMPGTDDAGARALAARIAVLVVRNNQAYADMPLNIAVGMATTTASDRIQDAIKLADRQMYQDKARFYDATRRERAAGR